MRRKGKTPFAGHVAGHVKKMSERMYSEPKLHIAKKIIDGEKVPSVDPGAKWYVYFYYRDPYTGKMGKEPWKVYRDINRETTVRDRLRIGNAWVEVIHDLLRDGFNPYDENSIDTTENDFEKGRYSVREAFEEALENKRNTWKESSYESYKGYVERFLKWCLSKGVDDLDIDKLTRRHVVSYLNQLGRGDERKKGIVPTSVANHKRHLSSIYGKIVQDGIVRENIFSGIVTKNNKPQKNAPFTPDEIKAIKELSQKEYPLLYDFLRFIFYSLLRNNEIVSIRLRDINMEKRTISIETKGETMDHIRIIRPLYEYFKGLNLEKYEPDDFLLTPLSHPGKWDRDKTSRRRFYSTMFRDVRKELGIDLKKNSYSFRHNAAIDLYLSFLSDGLSENDAISRLKGIMRHKSDEVTRMYLRGIGAILPDDWADSYNVDF